MKVAHALRAAIVTGDKDFKRHWMRRKNTPDVRGLILLDCEPNLQAARLREAIGAIDAEFARANAVGVPPLVIIRRETIVLWR
jgi:predicted nuclease of predicted toxin-antitoxin system